MSHRDAAVRQAAFAFVEHLGRVCGDVVPRTALAEGFVFEGRRVPLAGPQGIFKPALCDYPLTITTVPVVEGRARPYDDDVSASGLLGYRYRGHDPRHPDNVGLRRAMSDGVPLIYLFGLVRGQYAAVWPVYVVGDDPRALTFEVAFDEPGLIGGASTQQDESRRRYVTRAVRARLHQAGFRERVLSAYGGSCSICRLRHRQLLDAAHILPDAHPLGEPTVRNGLALCKLHHAAFDADIVGVRPNLIVDVRADILREVDGPMLVHGLQGVAGQRLHVPRRADQKPSTVLLEERYERFRAAR